MIKRLCPSLACHGRAAGSALLLISLLGCTAGPSQTGSLDRVGHLRNHLSVAAAALAAGQPEVARKQYQALAERFDRSPEPLLGLGYVAFGSREYLRAVRHFVKAAALARNAPALRAEALFGAGRAALALGRVGAARRYLAAAQQRGGDLPLAPWIANAVAVAAALDGDIATGRDESARGTPPFVGAPGDRRESDSLAGRRRPSERSGQPVRAV